MDKEIEAFIKKHSIESDKILTAILESTNDIQEIKRMVDIMFENMGTQEMDIAMLKETTLEHKKKFQKLGV